jgi:hypothetical protein
METQDDRYNDLTEALRNAAAIASDIGSAATDNLADTLWTWSDTVENREVGKTLHFLKVR